MKSIRDSKKLYWGLIITFFILYALVGFVSTLHSITFFELANSMWMAVLLGITYEVGQASVLFSILMTKNSQKILPWLLMILLTALQVTANVYASFKFMDGSGSMDWTFWQRSILFWLEADGPEMFKVVISWISGALLPVVALGMTALVAENLKLKDEEEKEETHDIVDDFLHHKYGFPNEDTENEGNIDEKDIDEGDIDEPKFKPVGPENLVTETISDEKIKENTKKASLKNLEKYEDDAEPVIIPTKEERLQILADELLDPKNHLKFPNKVDVSGNTPPGVVEVIRHPIVIPLNPKDLNTDDWKKMIGVNDINYQEPLSDDKLEGEKTFDTDPNTGLFPKKPLNNQRGWHLKKEFIDTNGDVYHFGQYQLEKKKTPKKAKG